MGHKEPFMAKSRDKWSGLRTYLPQRDKNGLKRTDIPERELKPDQWLYSQPDIILLKWGQKIYNDVKVLFWRQL